MLTKCANVIRHETFPMKSTILGLKRDPKYSNIVNQILQAIKGLENMVRTHSKLLY